MKTEKAYNFNTVKAFKNKNDLKTLERFMDNENRFIKKKGL